MSLQKIILASGNPGKLTELRAMLREKKVDLISQSDLEVGEVEETGLNFAENALIKARHACKETGLPAIADDSGIEVDALGGKPGIYSARYAGVSGATADAENNVRLLQDLKEVPEQDRTARFQCVIVYLIHERDSMPLICQGSWEGRILFTERGRNGFGYDPLFYVPTHGCTSAQLDSKVKNSLSHRGQALRKLLECWNLRP